LAGFQVTINGRFWVTAEGIRSLEMALRTNQSFAELLLAAERALESENDLREHAASLAEYDAVIRELRQTPVGAFGNTDCTTPKI
jgi:hypothetical protein